MNLYLTLKRIYIRTIHWEYWPMWMVYAPVMFYWLWLSIRARTFFFFGSANPSIKYSGFVHESKTDIYRLLPKGSYPATVCCTAGTSISTLPGLLARHQLNFPVIAKPDIGERGIGVALLHSQKALDDYCLRSKVDFLLQQYISYPMEAGIFYYRMPGSNCGYISGITGKRFLSVTGDGKTSVRGLLLKHHRSVLQLPKLESTYGTELDKILPKDEVRMLVPYGNHSLGTCFTDENHRIHQQLQESIDAVCSQVPGFYFGRLDIRFKSWESLAAGKDFMIIELNGAGSEPTHVYDPSHSIFFAWKEICRHWKLLFEISQLNQSKNKHNLMTFSNGVRLITTHNRHRKLMTEGG